MSATNKGVLVACSPFMNGRQNGRLGEVVGLWVGREVVGVADGLDVLDVGAKDEGGNVGKIHALAV